MREMRTLTIKCHEKGCPEYAQVQCPKDEPAPKYRVVHEEDGTHNLQTWIDPVVPEGGSLTWDKTKWG